MLTKTDLLKKQYLGYMLKGFLALIESYLLWLPLQGLCSRNIVRGLVLGLFKEMLFLEQVLR